MTVTNTFTSEKAIQHVKAKADIIISELQYRAMTIVFGSAAAALQTQSIKSMIGNSVSGLLVTPISGGNMSSGNIESISTLPSKIITTSDVTSSHEQNTSGSGSSSSSNNRLLYALAATEGPVSTLRENDDILPFTTILRLTQVLSDIDTVVKFRSGKVVAIINSNLCWNFVEFL